MGKWDWLEKSKSVEILLKLLEEDKRMYFESLSKSVGGSYITIRDRLRDLGKEKLIYDKKEEVSDKGRYVGVKRYIWLTEKGRKVAEKLKEIEEIMEGGEK